MIIIITCAESDAVPFLRSLPEAGLEDVTLVTTPAPGEFYRAAGLGRSIWVMARVSSVRDIRRLAAESGAPLTILLGPDYGWPTYRRRFVQRRLVAPWLLPRGARADLVRVVSGGTVSWCRPHCGRVELLLRLYPAQAALLLSFAGLGALKTPLGAVTLARLLPSVLLSEARARVGYRRWSWDSA